MPLFMHIYYSNMNNINWDSLRYFLAAANGGSLTAAAEMLGSNQPTVGRYIDALEQSLGTKLFKRSVKGLSLTDEGAFILEQSQAIQATITKIQHTLTGDKNEIAGTIRLTLPEGLSLEVITPLLAKFHTTYPNIKLLLNVSAQSMNLIQGESDMAIRLYRPKETDLVVKSLGEMEMGLFASQQYLQQHGTPTSLEELARHRVIAYGEQLSNMPENKFLLTHASPVLMSDSTSTRLRATLDGVGISIQPKLVQHHNPQLKPVLKDQPLPNHAIWLVYHKDLRNQARIRALAKFIIELFE